MARPVNTNLDMQSASRIQNLPDGVSPQEPATVAQLTAAIEGFVTKKVRVASVSNLNLASPGANIDGTAMSLNDRFLAKDQTAPAENGLYVWNGAAVPATRASDANSTVELEGCIAVVEEGTVNAGTNWRQVSVNFTLGSGAVSFVAFGTGASPASETTAGVLEIATQGEANGGSDDTRVITALKLRNATGINRSYAALFGDGSSTQYDITHNKGTTDVGLVVQRVSDKTEVMVEWVALDVNTVRIKNLTVAPASNAYRAIVFLAL